MMWPPGTGTIQNAVVAPPLGGERRDRIEKDGVVLPDRERQVARRVGVAGADRPPVGVVDQQTAEPDEQARPQLAPAAEDGGHGFMLTALVSYGVHLHPRRGWGEVGGYHKAPPSGSAAGGRAALAAWGGSVAPWMAFHVRVL